MCDPTHPFPAMSSSREDALLFPEITSYVNEYAHPSPETSSHLNKSAHPFREMKSRLYRAAVSGDVDALNKFIEGKENVLQEFTALRNSVLHIAISCKKLPFIRRLLKEVKKNFDEGREFICERNSDGNSALHLAAFHGQHDLIEDFLSLMEGDVEAVSIESHKTNLLRFENREGNTVLHEAAKGGNLEVVEILLKHDASLAGLSNCEGETAVFIASQIGNEDMVSRLLECVASNSNMNRKDGQTPLHSAVFYGHIGVVEKLLKHSPELAKQTDGRGRTAMHMLALSSESLYNSISRIEKSLRMIVCSRFETSLRKITRLLLDEDISLCYKQDGKKQTPLHIAVELGKYELVDILINYGGDCIDLADEDGRTPLHLAVKNAGRISDASPFSKLRSYRNMLSSLMSKRSLNHRDNWGRAPVQIAIENTESDEGLSSSIFKLLLANGTLLTPEILEDRRRIEPSSVLSRIKAESISVNAVLIATISFAAGFTLPGGLDSQPGQKPKAVFINVVLFNLFVICDTFSFCTSIASAILVQYKGSGKREAEILVQCSLMLLWSALVSLVVAFGAAVHLVIAPSPWLVGTIWTMVSLAPSAISMVLGGSNNVYGEARYLHWMLLVIPLNCVLIIPYTIYHIFCFADILNDVRRWIIKLFKQCRAQISKVRDQ